MAERLTAPQCSMLHRFVGLGWHVCHPRDPALAVYGWWYRKNLPHYEVTVCAEMQALIELGYLVRQTAGGGYHRIEATERGMALRCLHCHSGLLYDDENDLAWDCPDCQNGLMLSAEISPLS